MNAKVEAEREVKQQQDRSDDGELGQARVTIVGQGTVAVLKREGRVNGVCVARHSRYYKNNLKIKHDAFRNLCTEADYLLGQRFHYQMSVCNN